MIVSFLMGDVNPSFPFWNDKWLAKLWCCYEQVPHAADPMNDHEQDGDEGHDFEASFGIWVRLKKLHNSAQT